MSAELFCNENPEITRQLPGSDRTLQPSRSELSCSAQQVSSQLSKMGVRPATISSTPKVLSFGIRELDRFFEGGLPVGAVSEWGVPFGQGGREVVVRWLARVLARTECVDADDVLDQRPCWALWVYSRRFVPRSPLLVYPPAWLARGVTLSKIRFARSGRPVNELKPVFMEPFFRIIVLDAPERFSDDDCAFVARQARIHGQTVLLLRDFFLSPKRGNIWAKVRLNCARHLSAGLFPGGFELLMVRGLSPRHLVWRPEADRRDAGCKDQGGSV